MLRVAVLVISFLLKLRLKQITDVTNYIYTYTHHLRKSIKRQCLYNKERSQYRGHEMLLVATVQTREG